MSELTPEQRTRKEMMKRPELVEHFAYNTWHSRAGKVGDASAEWAALPESEREQWIALVWSRRMPSGEARHDR